MIFQAFSNFTARKRNFAKVMFLHVSVCPQGAGAAPGQVPPGRYTPWAGTPPGSKPPGRYTPQAGTPPWTGTPPPSQVHPLGRYITPREQCMLEDTGNKLALRILLECILVEINFKWALKSFGIHFCRKNIPFLQCSKHIVLY